MTRAYNDRNRFYLILQKLSERLGYRYLSECHGRLSWPKQGVYFFFESGEYRQDGVTPRVVRVGTHAVSKGSRTTLWNRLSTHRGTVKTGGGNHRASIFRKHVGGALLHLDESLCPSSNKWGEGSTASKEIRQQELKLEQAVSHYIGSMPFLWIEAIDEAGSNNLRADIETNSIGLLSLVSPTGDSADKPSEDWLGNHCPHRKVRESGLWNVRDTDAEYDPGFIAILSALAEQTDPLFVG